MYEGFYGFTEKPFNITPDPKFLYLSPKHQEAISHLLYGIQERGGFVVITGEVGTGKTILCRYLLGQLDERTEGAVILNPNLSELELLRAINEDFGIRSTGTTKKALIDELNHLLLERRLAGQNMVLVIDEAQNLSPSVLEQIRLLSNLETEKEKLIQIILLGQPELRELLAREDLRQLNQRVTARYHLGALSEKEMTGYIEHRMRVADAPAGAKFQPKTLKQLFRFTKGTPRLINVLCDRCLLAGFAQNTQEITPEILARAIQEVAGVQPKAPLLSDGAKRIAAIATAVVLCIGLGVGITTAWQSGQIPFLQGDDTQPIAAEAPAVPETVAAGPMAVAAVAPAEPATVATPPVAPPRATTPAPAPKPVVEMKTPAPTPAPIEKAAAATPPPALVDPAPVVTQTALRKEERDRELRLISSLFTPPAATAAERPEVAIAEPVAPAPTVEDLAPARVEPERTQVAAIPEPQPILIAPTPIETSPPVVSLPVDAHGDLVITTGTQMAALVGSLDPQASRLDSARALFGLWGRDFQVPKVANQPEFHDFYTLARHELMRCSESWANAETLAQVDMPGILEVFSPRTPASRYIVLAAVHSDGTGTILWGENGTARVALDALDECWRRRAFFFWEDYETLGEVVREGDSGWHVQWIQEGLAELGYLMDIEVTGSYDSATRRAVIDFQKSFHLMPDGIVGPRTRMVLYSRRPAYATPNLTAPSTL